MHDHIEQVGMSGELVGAWFQPTTSANQLALIAADKVALVHLQNDNKLTKVIIEFAKR